jgi:membrane protein implicated in regulation of membrane protease activity
MICALVGGTIFILQFVLSIVGAGADDLDLGHDIPHDAPHDFSGHSDGATGHAHDHGSTWMFGVISFRTVVAALTFFGLAGLASLAVPLRGPVTLLIAIGAGAAAMYGVHYLMRALYSLRYDGTARIQRTIGERGTVYVPIPPHREGLGKIQIRTQGRIMEYAAQTRGSEKLKTGTTVEVVDILSPMTVEVRPVDEDTLTAAGDVVDRDEL